jgi:hypothetical protein
MINKSGKNNSKNKVEQVYPKKKKMELKKVKLLLDDMLDFLAEIPVNKYHDYREFRNLRLRGKLINKFMRERYA